MDLSSELNALCQRAEGLIQRAELLKTKTGIAGVGKVKKKIQAELSFIKSLQAGTIVPKKNQLRSTNLSHLAALLHTAETFGQVTALLQPMHYDTDDGLDSCLVVDVVGHDGRAWIKVTTRKAGALHRIWQGEGEYGEHDIVQQVEQYCDASAQNLQNFSPPTVHVAFFSGITREVADELLDLDAVVHGNIFEPDEDIRNVKPDIPVFHSQEEFSESPLESEQSAVNLDVTTLIALVSDLCHGGSSYTFNEPLIEELSLQERKHPLLPELETFLKGKTMMVCETALKAFRAILETIGGTKENRRAEGLLQRLSIVPDQLSERTSNLSPSNRIKERARVIFGTGDALKIPTATANEHFVRAAANQGVNFSVFIHQSRALTEKKQLNPDKAAPSIDQPLGLDNCSILSRIGQLEIATQNEQRQLSSTKATSCHSNTDHGDNGSEMIDQQLGLDSCGRSSKIGQSEIATQNAVVDVI